MADYSKLPKKELIMTLYARDLMLENERKRLEYLPEKYFELKQQLAEKEKEIEYQESMKILAVDNQNKKAIEQLEKVKEWCENHKFSDEYDYIIAYEEDEEDASGCEDYFKDYIDNQIKQLKEMK